MEAPGKSLCAAGSPECVIAAPADALQWLHVADEPLEAARIYSNRAQALLKLAAAHSAAATDGSQDDRMCRYCKCGQHAIEPRSSTTSSNSDTTGDSSSSTTTSQQPTAAAAADSVMLKLLEAQHIAVPVCRGECQAHGLALAAVDDCNAALDTGQCSGTFRGKVRFATCDGDQVHRTNMFNSHTSILRH